MRRVGKELVSRRSAGPAAKRLEAKCDLKQVSYGSKGQFPI